MAAWFGEEPAVPPQPIERVDWVQGLESPAEALTNIVRWLVVHGYPDREILMAAGGNALRMLEFAWRSGAAG